MRMLQYWPVTQSEARGRRSAGAQAHGGRSLGSELGASHGPECVGFVLCAAETVDSGWRDRGRRELRPERWRKDCLVFFFDSFLKV